MSDELRMCCFSGIIETNEINTPNDELKINADTTIAGNLKVKGFVEEINKREIIHDGKIDITPESNIKSGLIIDFKPLENEYFYNLSVIINEGEFINKTEFLYGKSICILSQCYNKYSVSLSIHSDKLMIKLNSKYDVDLKNINTIRIKLTI
jgi:hypothetical protein